MAITHGRAVELAREKLEPGWTHGTFCIDDRNIVENEELYVLEIGAREFLVDGDRSYEAIGGVTVVYKEDGRIGSLASVEVAMDPTVKIRPNPSPTLEV